jgi:putative transposase
VRECIRRRRPYGDDAWAEGAARRLGLQASLRPRGRPRKRTAEPPSLFDPLPGDP